MQQFALSWQMSGNRGPKRDADANVSRSAPDSFLHPPLRLSSPLQKPPPAISPRPSMSNFSNQAFAGPPTHPTFGVDLGEQMQRDGVEVPRILEKCCEAIELHGLESMGIYRLSGTTSRVQRLKAKLDRGALPLSFWSRQTDS